MMSTTTFRRRLGRIYYIWKRRMNWYFGKTVFAQPRETMLQVSVFQHQTPLLRQLKNVDMYLQYNKITKL